MRFGGRTRLLVLVLCGVGFVAGMAGICSAEVAASKTPPGATDANSQKIVVKVVDKETGKPLAGAKVMTQDFRTGFAVNGSGVAAILPGKTANWVDMAVVCPGYVGQRRVLKKDGGKAFPEVYVFSLEKGMRVGGVVRDSDGAPIEGVKVMIVTRDQDQQENPADGPIPYVFEHATTDKTGAWWCESVPVTMKNVEFFFEHPKHQRTWVGMMAPDESLKSGSFATVMKKGIRLCGVVRDSNGSAIAGATVIRGESVNHYETVNRITDGQGRFIFEDTEESRQVLTASAKGYAPDLKVIPADKLVEEAGLELGPANILRGKLVDSAGAPVADANMMVIKWRGYNTIPMSTMTDSDGRFEMGGLPGDGLRLRLAKKNKTPKEIANVVADGKYKELVFGDALRVKGKVTDAGTGKPIADFKVVPGLEWESGQGVIWQDAPGWSRSYKDGQYDYTFQRDGTRYAVRIVAKGYEKTGSRLIGPDEKMVVCDFSLVKSTILEGVVLGPDGKPASGVTVILGDKWGVVMENGKLSNEGMSLDNGEPYPTTKTDPNGRFSLPEPNVPYTVAAVGSAGWGGFSAEGFRQAGRIKLQEWGRIEGRYVVGTRPAGNRKVKIEHIDSGEETGYIIARYEKLTDADGKFLIEKVLPGKLRVEWVPVEVSPGQTANVKLGGRGRTVTAELELPKDLRNIMSKIAVECWAVTGPDWMDWASGVPWPANVDEMTSTQIWQWVRDFSKTPEGKEWSAARKAMYQQRIAYTGKMEGSRITIEDVSEGNYTLSCALVLKYEGRDEPNYSDTSMQGSADAKFAVPPVQPDELDKPLDIGSIKVVERPRPGDKAPAIEVDGAGSQKVRLADHRGKVVLLVVYSSDIFRDPNYKNPIWLEFRKAYDRFAGSNDLSVIGVALEPKTDPIARALARELGLKWTQGFAGDQRMPICSAFSMMFTPRIVLIDRDGKIIANGIRGHELIKKLEESLAGGR
jgi:peroxiredoxin